MPPTLLAPEIATSVEDDDPVWPSARIGIAEALWGEGFLCPGGAAETLRLAKPMGLSAASSLLLLGAGSGGSIRSIATSLGVWVSGFEANPRLAALANERSIRAGLGRRAQVETWDPVAPKFPSHYYHHGMALEPLHGAQAGTDAGRAVARTEAGRTACAGGACGGPAARCRRSDGRRLGASRSPPPHCTGRTGSHQGSGTSRLRRADRRGRVPPSHAAIGGGLAHGGPGDGGHASDTA